MHRLPIIAGTGNRMICMVLHCAVLGNIVLQRSTGQRKLHGV